MNNLRMIMRHSFNPLARHWRKKCFCSSPQTRHVAVPCASYARLPLKGESRAITTGAHWRGARALVELAQAATGALSGAKG